MKFNKSEVSMGGSYLEDGVHIISFDDIDRKTTKKGKEMWVLTLKDAKGSTTRKNILDNDYKFNNGKTAFETELERMLYSISDAGFEIPENVDFTFDNIDQFLKSKPYKAFIRVRPQKNDPEYNEAIFISKDQFDKDIDKQANDAFGDVVDPFATSIPVKDDPFATSTPVKDNPFA